MIFPWLPSCGLGLSLLILLHKQVHSWDRLASFQGTLLGFTYVWLIQTKIKIFKGKMEAVLFLWKIQHSSELGSKLKTKVTWTLPLRYVDFRWSDGFRIWSLKVICTCLPPTNCGPKEPLLWTLMNPFNLPYLTFPKYKKAYITIKLHSPEDYLENWIKALKLLRSAPDT